MDIGLIRETTKKHLLDIGIDLRDIDSHRHPVPRETAALGVKQSGGVVVRHPCP